MERTPEDIKKGLEYLSIKDVARKLDAWEDGIPYDYVEDAAADALSLIQQLQDDNAQQARCIENMTDKLNAMNDEVAKLQAERDAAVADIRLAFTSYVGTCRTCKHGENQTDCIEPLRCGNCENEKCKCQSCDIYDSNWEWRGVQKEESDDGKE